MFDSGKNDISTLISGLRSQEKEERAKFTQEIAHYGDSIVTDLIPLLQDKDWKVRYRAAEALGMIGSPDAVPDLITTCHDEKDHVRYMAAKSLGHIKSRDAIQVLIHLLTDEHSYTRGIASEGLAAMHDRRGISALESAIAHEMNPEIKERMNENLTLLKKTA